MMPDRFIFAALYEWSKARWSEDHEWHGWPHTACSGLMMTVASIGGLLSLWLGPLPWMSLWLSAGILGVLTLFVFSSFLQRRKYLSIAEEFRPIHPTRKRRIRRAAWLYLLLSYAAPFGIIWWAHSDW